MHVRQITMTPDLAAKLLGNNPRNRLPSVNRVTALAAALRERRFVAEAAGPVIVGSDGELHDGQHRLKATVESGISWPCILIEDAPEEARLHYDTGKRRSFADYLRLRGVAETTGVAALTGLLWRYENGHLASRTSFIRSRLEAAPDHAQLWAFFQENNERIVTALRASRRVRENQSGLLSSSAIGAAIAVTSDIDYEDSQEFTRQLALSGDSGVDHQIMILLRALGNQRSPSDGKGRGDQQHQLALLFKGWNCWRDGEKPQVLVWKLGGRNPERFPVPH